MAAFVLSPFQALIKMEMLNFLKGIFFVIWYAPLSSVLWFVQCNGGSWQCGKLQYCMIIAASLGALIGHVKSCGISFKGGKAVTTVVGTLFALDWRVGLITAILWALIVFISKYSSWGGLIALSFSPIIMFIFKFYFSNVRLFQVILYTLYCALCAIYIIYKHKTVSRPVIENTSSITIKSCF